VISGRLHSSAFAALCLAGVAASVGLTVREVARTAPVAVRVTDQVRQGATTTVTVSVRNTTDQDRCATVRVAARDRNGHDLASATAARELALPAHARRTVTARLTLTARERTEKFHAFYPSAAACP